VLGNSGSYALTLKDVAAPKRCNYFARICVKGIKILFAINKIKRKIDFDDAEKR